MNISSVDAKKRCIDIIERFPEEGLAALAALLEEMFKDIDEELDDAFCLALLERHEQIPDRDEPGIPIEEAAARLGIVLGEDELIIEAVSTND